MTFLAFETDRSGGFSPIELYTFTYQSQVFRYTTGQEPFTVAGNDYIPAYIQRANIYSSGSTDRNVLRITVNKDNPVSLFYRQRVPVDTFSVLIERVHTRDPDQERRIVFNGSIQNILWRNDEIADISAAPITNLLERLILRPDHQAKCNHVIYDDFCTLSRSTFQAATTVLNVSNITQITVDNLPDVTRADAYIGGFMLFGQQLSTILTQTGNVLGILLPLEGLADGDVVQIAPGCQNSYPICRNSFNNHANNLGFKDLPRRNPVGTTIYGNA